MTLLRLLQCKKRLLGMEYCGLLSTSKIDVNAYYVISAVRSSVAVFQLRNHQNYQVMHLMKSVCSSTLNRAREEKMAFLVRKVCLEAMAPR